MNIEIITAPLVGGFIGLITNSLAIKMLFRPYREIRIMGLHMPFTPGLIPKEKPRIAHAIAQVISNYILDNDTILSALASDAIHAAYEQKYEKKLAEWKALDLTCEEMLEKYGLTDAANISEVKMRNSVCAYFVEQCTQEEIAKNLVDGAFSQVLDQLNPLLYKIGKNVLNSVKESVTAQVEDMIKIKGAEWIGRYLDNVYVEWMEKPVCEVVVLFENKMPNLKQDLWEKYKELVEHKIGRFLATLNIEKIVENKINEYDLEELEKMIMEISKKELNALVWLGGLLGIIMGFVNLLF